MGRIFEKQYFAVTRLCNSKEETWQTCYFNVAKNKYTVFGSRGRSYANQMIRLSCVSRFTKL